MALDEPLHDARDAVRFEHVQRLVGGQVAEGGAAGGQFGVTSPVVVRYYLSERANDSVND